MATANIITSLRGEHRVHFCQLGDVVVAANGHNPNKAISLRNLTGYDLGVAAPGAAPTGAYAGGALTGDYRWRVRWKDNLAGAVSLPSAELARTMAAEQATITRPGSPPARATHWILERTLAGGSVFFPVNVSATAPDGTAIATTTYVDNNTDSALGAMAVLRYSSRQGVAAAYRFCCANARRVFLGGGRTHKPTCTLTNASATVTSADGGFLATMVGQDLVAPADSSGATYRIATYVSADEITITPVYAGASGTKAVWISGPRDWGIWSEPDEPEAYGAPVVGGLSGLSNELRIGDDGEALTGILGLGDEGVLWAKAQSLWLHRYQSDPDPIAGDGRLMRLPTRRGAVGPMALAFVDGAAYGMDRLGVWRLQPGGLPEDLSAAIASDWRRGGLNFAQSDNWHIVLDPARGELLFFVCEGSDTYPRLAYCWGLDERRWLGTRTYPLGVPCGIELPDDQQQPALAYYQEATGTVKSYAWLDGIGKSLGAPASTSPLSGTATGGSTTTLQCASATWPTAGEGLKGVTCRIVHADGTIEYGYITSNTSNQLTFSNTLAATVAAGDTFDVGPLEALVTTGRLDAGFPERKKRWLGVWLWVKKKSACAAPKVRCYFDGSDSGYADRVAAVAEDGVTLAVAGADATIDATLSDAHRYWVELGGKWATDLQIQIWSSAGGAPWELLALKALFEVDEAEQPRKR